MFPEFPKNKCDEVDGLDGFLSEYQVRFYRKAMSIDCMTPGASTVAWRDGVLTCEGFPLFSRLTPNTTAGTLLLMSLMSCDSGDIWGCPWGLNFRCFDPRRLLRRCLKNPSS